MFQNMKYIGSKLRYHNTAGVFDQEMMDWVKRQNELRKQRARLKRQVIHIEHAIEAWNRYGDTLMVDLDKFFEERRQARARIAGGMKISSSIKSQ